MHQHSTTTRTTTAYTYTYCVLFNNKQWDSGRKIWFLSSSSSSSSSLMCSHFPYGISIRLPLASFLGSPFKIAGNLFSFCFLDCDRPRWNIIRDLILRFFFFFLGCIQTIVSILHCPRHFFSLVVLCLFSHFEKNFKINIWIVQKGRGSV